MKTRARRHARAPSSSLLSLPQEVQDQIYSHVIGNATICIHERVCRNQLSLKKPRESQCIVVAHERPCKLCRAVRGSGKAPLVLDYQAYSDETPLPDASSTITCKGWYGPFTPCGHRKDSQRDISLAFFRTCRHVYDSAMPLLYRKYTFCFGLASNTQIPAAFLRRLTPLQSASLRTVVISLHCVDSDPSEGCSRWYATAETAFGFHDEVLVVGNWTEIVEGDKASGFYGLAGLSHLRKLILACRWQRESGRESQPFLAAFAGLRKFGRLQLQVDFSERNQLDDEIRRNPVLEKRIQMRLLGLDEAGLDVRTVDGEVGKVDATANEEGSDAAHSL